MSQVGVWQVLDIGPTRLLSSKVGLEDHLEGWIERDPDLVQLGLRILARQLVVDGGRIDLLALDPQGRWTIIEVKRGEVDRSTIAQAMDYASALAEMDEATLRALLGPHLQDRSLNLNALLRERGALDSLDPEARGIAMLVVGTGRAPGLERMAKFLQERFGVPVVPVLFTVFETAKGETVLVRELPEAEALPVDDRRWKVSSIEDLLTAARSGGHGRVAEILVEVARERGLGFRPWKKSLMITPPTDGRRCLFTWWVQPEEAGLRVYVESAAFAEFFGGSVEEAESVLGSGGFRLLDIRGAEALAEGVRRLVPKAPEEI